MSDTMSHRGPDDRGIVWFDALGSGIAHRRLSIIDLSPAGHQPMSSDDGRLWITFNGEIYNYKEIRRRLAGKGYSFCSESDTEVLLKAYQEWGVKSLALLNGMFAFGVYDTKACRLFAARDHIGIKPLYYWSKDGAIIFASEIKAILASGLVERKPDYDALHTPARYQISPYTGFKGIYKLPPGHHLTFEDGKLQVESFWDIHPSEYVDGKNEEAIIGQLDDLLNDSVRLQMISDVPVGIFLSGGLDSSLTAALMRCNTDREIHSFTIKFSPKDEKFERTSDDSKYAKIVASKFGFVHHEILLEPTGNDLLPLLTYHLDEPLSDPAIINTYLIAKNARDLGIIVLLNGMGGDEIFGGYRKQLACLVAESYQHHVPSLLRKSFEIVINHFPVATTAGGFRTIRWAKRFLSFASLAQPERYLTSDLSLSKDQYARLFLNDGDYYSSYFYKAQKDRLSTPTLSYLTRMCLNDTKVFLPEHNLAYSDKSSMAASVESRPPLIDFRIVEFMFSLPPSLRIRRNIQKYLLKKVAERYLPRQVIYRPKASFGAPLRAWVRGPLKAVVDDLLSEESVKARGLYNPKFVRELVYDDRVGRQDNALVLWTLLTNEIWFRTFFG